MTNPEPQEITPIPTPTCEKVNGVLVIGNNSKEVIQNRIRALCRPRSEEDDLERIVGYLKDMAEISMLTAMNKIIEGEDLPAERLAAVAAADKAAQVIMKMKSNNLANFGSKMNQQGDKKIVEFNKDLIMREEDGLIEGDSVVDSEVSYEEEDDE